jgi:hypothetical protein
MRKVFLGLLCVVSFHAFAGEMLECESRGYAASADDMDKIDQQPRHSEFLVEKDKVIQVAVGRAFYAAEPEDFGFEKDVLTFYNRHANQVLYIYKSNGKTEVGVSALNKDSDDLYLDKDEFTQCGFNESRRGVALKTSFTMHSRRVDPALPVFTF